MDASPPCPRPGPGQPRRTVTLPSASPQSGSWKPISRPDWSPQKAAVGGPPRQLRPCSPPAPGGVRLPPCPVHPTPRGHVGIPKEIKRLLNTDLTHLSVCVKCGYVGMAHNIRGWGPTATGQPASRAVASATPAPPPGGGKDWPDMQIPRPHPGLQSNPNALAHGEAPDHCTCDLSPN